MRSKSNVTLQKFTRFYTGMIHAGYPKIDLLQLEPGSI